MILKGADEFKNLLVTVLQAQFGAENVQMEGPSIMHIALKNKVLIAFKDPALPNWSIIEDKRGEKGPNQEQQQELLKAIMPAEVLLAMDKK